MVEYAKRNGEEWRDVAATYRCTSAIHGSSTADRFMRLLNRIPNFPTPP